MHLLPPARWLRLWAVIAAASLILALVVPLAIARPVAAQSGDTPDPVDLAALVPGVLDLEDAGQDAFVPSNTIEYDSLERYFGAQGFEDLEGELGLFADLEDAGFVRQYNAWWSPEEAVVANNDGERWNPLTQFRFAATQFADEDGASDGLTALTGDADEIDADPLGDESVFSDSPSGYDGLEFAGVDASVRVGALILEVTVFAQEDSPVSGDELDLATDLITAYVDRVESLDDLPTDTIGLAPVRFTGASLRTNRNGYLIRDGASVWAYTGESIDDREAYTGNLVDQGIVSQYQLLQILGTEELADEAFDYVIETVATAFETDAAAGDAFDDSMSVWEDADFTVEELDDAPSLGDESVAFTAVDADETDFNTFLSWRDGATLFRLDINLPSRFANPDALFAFADAQTACLDDGDCGQFRELPDEILDDAGPLVDDGSTPADDIPTNGTPEPDDATPEPRGGEGSYTGDAFDFSLSWDTDAWTQDESYDPLIGAEGVRLDRTGGGSLFIDVIDSRSGRNVSTCLEDISDTVLDEDGVDDVEAAEDENGDEIAGETDTYAYAAYQVTFDEAPGLDYIGCATLEDGETAVAFIYIGTDVENIDAQIDDLDDVIDGYEAS